MNKLTYLYGAMALVASTAHTVTAKQNLDYEKQLFKKAAQSCDFSQLTQLANNDAQEIRILAQDKLQDCASVNVKQALPMVASQADTDKSTEAPTFHSFSYSPSSINVDAGSVAVDVTLTLFDADSAVDSASVTIYPPDGLPNSHQKSIYFSSNEWTAGTVENTYTAKETLVFDKNDAAGKWAARILNTEDAKGNIEYDDITAEDMEKAGSNPYLTIANSNEIDVTPPEFHAFALNVRELDVSSGSKSVDVTLTLLDKGSKVHSASMRLLPPEGAPDSHYKYISFYSSSWQAGDEENTYKATKTVTFDETDVAGKWSAQLSARRDINENSSYTTVTAEDMEKAGSNPYFTIVNTNEVDVTPPTFESLTFSSNSVDVATGSVSIDVTLTLKDEGAGVDSAILYLNAPDAKDSYQYKSVVFSSNEWSAGDEAHTYKATETIVFESSDLEGKWSAVISAVSDKNNNDSYDDIEAETIAKAGSNPYITVSKNGGGNLTNECASTIASTDCVIKLGESYTAEMDNAQDRDMYKFTVTEAGTFTASTAGELDMFGVLYMPAGNYVAADNNSGEDNNFALTYSVEPGDYYLMVREYKKAKGTYVLSTDFKAVKECASTAVATSCTLGLDEEVEAQMDVSGDRDMYEITVTEAGSLTLSTSGDLDTFGVLYPSNGSYVAADNNSGEGNNFSLTYQVAPGTYYILVREYKKAVGEYKLKASFKK